MLHSILYKTMNHGVTSQVIGYGEYNNQDY